VAERKNLLLRLDPAVYDALARWAGDGLRSVNAQIEYALRLALASAGRTPRPARRAAPMPDPAEPQGATAAGDPGSPAGTGGARDAD
jgi:hypothetical protein